MFSEFQEKPVCLQHIFTNRLLYIWCIEEREHLFGGVLLLSALDIS